jgi:maltose alpha-D-glucosyltransferase/alpha-amylase
MLLAEANVPPDESLRYFGEDGERLQMMLNFPVNQRLFYALATADLEPLIWALEQTRKRPSNAQWVQFLRSHDELDLGRLTVEQRQKVFDAFGPTPRMQLYDRGIRRRLAPMLGNNRRHLELAFSPPVLAAGTPMMQYGDEIGMGDDLRLPERECARTPMQWTSDRHGGFSTGRRTVLPVIRDEVYGYQRVNVADQRRDSESLLNWTERIIRMRKVCPEISWGDFSVVRTNAPEVLAIRYDWRGTSLVTLHNFSHRAQSVRLSVGKPHDTLDRRPVRRPSQSYSRRRHSQAATGTVRMALVPRRRPGQHAAPQRSGAHRREGHVAAVKPDMAGKAPGYDTEAPRESE